MKFSGKCLCGMVSYKSHVEPVLILNCHCEDCRRSTGAVYGTNVMIAEDQLEIHGELSTFKHKAKSGNVMTKRFCPNCGTLMFGNSSGRTNVVSVRAGTIDQTDIINPAMNVLQIVKYRQPLCTIPCLKQVKCLTANVGKRNNPHPLRSQRRSQMFNKGRLK